MTVTLQTLIYNPELGGDVLTTVGKIDFDPNAYKTIPGAAKAFHKALCEYGEGLGFNMSYCRLYTPDDMYQGVRQWAVCWEDGPFEWAINMSAQLSGPWGYTEPHYSFDLCFTE